MNQIQNKKKKNWWRNWFIKKKESDSKSNLELELRDKRTQYENESHNREELEKKLKTLEIKVGELEKTREESSSSLNKLKSDEASLITTVNSLQEEVDELDGKIQDFEIQERDLKEKFVDADRKRDEQTKIRSKIGGENTKLRNEIEIQKQLNEQNSKKIWSYCWFFKKKNWTKWIRTWFKS